MTDTPGRGAGGAAADHPLAVAIDRLAHLLPAQGPISIFIHHNTLHAFEHLPFEQAVEGAAGHLDRQPYLAEARYREKLASGRIRATDIDALLREQLGDRARQVVARVGLRADLWRAILLFGIPAASGHELAWRLDETAALSRFRRDVPPGARAEAGLGDLNDRGRDERRAVRRLWDACVDAVARAAETTSGVVSGQNGNRGFQTANMHTQVVVLPRNDSRGRFLLPVRHRDLLCRAYDIDVDAWIHPPLIRFLAGYLDQGLAQWPMPERRRGIHGCFLELYGTSLARLAGEWARPLPRLIAEDLSASRDALESLAHSLDALGVSTDERNRFLSAELLALRGWAGIVRQIEERPDRVPARDLKVTLAGYLAVRLLFERAALETAARKVRFDGALAQFAGWLRPKVATGLAPSTIERAWPLFHVAQLCGVDASAASQWTPQDVADLEAELGELDEIARRRILHQAFERAIRYRFYDALASRPPETAPRAPSFQAIFCLDEREESFRRHLEEVAPDAETLSTAGFFNVAMYHQSVSDAHPRPLCPVAIRPSHYVAEIEPEGDALSARSRRLQRRAAGFLGYNVQLGSRLPVRGALLMTVFGWLALVPLIVRVLFPWIFSRWSRVRHTTTTSSRTRLQLDRQPGPSPAGAHAGYTVREMADIVRRVIEDVGLRDRLAPIVLVVGHGSISLNNPHESAHDCGACGGGRGGPNARALAQMANDPRVRALVAAEGLAIGDRTWFVGAQRNTCNNDVEFFDEDLIPDAFAEAFERVKAAIDETRQREAHERCRRFDGVPAWFPPLAALAHVQGRAADLAQPRPEYGHATNAFCVIGRRARTRGLFLDRRAFLVSYDQATDPDAEILSRIMAAVVPVVAGINLEYYFSYVDPVGYGCGTKLPHNVTSLLGVMDGAQSDLRTGLPWQMVEIHEPARLAIAVEADRDRLRKVVEQHAFIERLVRNRWIWMAAIDPASGQVSELRAEGFVAHAVEHPLPIVPGDSADWYQGKRGFIPPARITRVPA